MRVECIYDHKTNMKSREGLTLLEVMISLLLLSFVSLALLSAETGSRHSVHMSRVYTEAIESLTSTLESVTFQDFDDIADQDLPGITVSDAGTDNPDDDVLGDMNVVVTDNGDDTKTISATLTWNYELRSKQVQFTKTLTTMVADF